MFLIFISRAEIFRVQSNFFKECLKNWRILESVVKNFSLVGPVGRPWLHSVEGLEDTFSTPYSCEIIQPLRRGAFVKLALAARSAAGLGSPTSSALNTPSTEIRDIVVTPPSETSLVSQRTDSLTTLPSLPYRPTLCPSSSTASSNYSNASTVSPAPSIGASLSSQVKQKSIFHINNCAGREKRFAYKDQTRLRYINAISDILLVLLVESISRRCLCMSRQTKVPIFFYGFSLI